MDQAEIRAKIASFPRWHYQFDLAGNLTPIYREKWIIRHRERKRYFFDPVVDLFGETRLNHHATVTRGARAEECGRLLSDFFAARR